VLFKNVVLTFCVGLGFKDLTAVIVLLLHLTLLVITDGQMLLSSSSLVWRNVCKKLRENRSHFEGM